MSKKDEPAIEVDARPMRVRRPVDDVARAKYLDTLAKTGSRSAAAAAARPHIASTKSAMNAMDAHIASNPAFKAAVMDAETKLLGKVEETILDRALNGVVVFQKKAANADGEYEVVEERIEHDNQLLLRVANRLGNRGSDPGAWAKETRVVVSGGTTNLHAVVDIDHMMEGMSSEAIKEMMAGAARAKELAAASDGNAEELVEDAEIVEDTESDHQN